ncbi:hypothetical protein MPHL43070_25695, partial [Mycolicibacterium phlei DSM 43070]
VAPATQARPAAPAAAARPRPTAGSHRPPPPRRTFSSGQRALLWAAGVFGALAIIIAILIVLNAQDRKDQTPTRPTVTDTVTEPVPIETPAALPAWTPGTEAGAPAGGEGQSGVTTPQLIASPATMIPLLSAPVPPGDLRLPSEQTAQ